MPPVEALNEGRSSKKKQPPLTETEIRSTLLAAQEMAPGEVDGLVEQLITRLPDVGNKVEDATDYWGVFAGLFVVFTWLILLPWWAWYLFHMNDSAASQWAAVFTSVWLGSILAGIATFLKRRFS